MSLPADVIYTQVQQEHLRRQRLHFAVGVPCDADCCIPECRGWWNAMRLLGVW